MDRWLLKLWAYRRRGYGFDGHRPQIEGPSAPAVSQRYPLPAWVIMTISDQIAKSRASANLSLLRPRPQQKRHFQQVNITCPLNQSYLKCSAIHEASNLTQVMSSQHSQVKIEIPIIENIEGTGKS